MCIDNHKNTGLSDNRIWEPVPIEIFINGLWDFIKTGVNNTLVIRFDTSIEIVNKLMNSVNQIKFW